jgi:hypothetical protein
MAARRERPEADHAASSLRARATRTWTARRGYGEAPTVVAVCLPVQADHIATSALIAWGTTSERTSDRLGVSSQLALPCP